MDNEFIFIVIATFVFICFAVAVCAAWEQFEKRVALKKPINYKADSAFKRSGKK